jgi:CubicO group peptidase (beta-lactamase class C family)
MTAQKMADRRLRLFSTGLALSLCLHLLTAPVAHSRVAALPSPEDFAAFFDAALPAQLAAEQVAGAMAAVVHRGELVYAKGYGCLPGRQSCNWRSRASSTCTLM